MRLLDNLASVNFVPVSVPVCIVSRHGLQVVSGHGLHFRFETAYSAINVVNIPLIVFSIP